MLAERQPERSEASALDRELGQHAADGRDGHPPSSGSAAPILPCCHRLFHFPVSKCTHAPHAPLPAAASVLQIRLPSHFDRETCCSSSSHLTLSHSFPSSQLGEHRENPQSRTRRKPRTKVPPARLQEQLRAAHRPGEQEGTPPRPRRGAAGRQSPSAGGCAPVASLRSSGRRRPAPSPLSPARRPGSSPKRAPRPAGRDASLTGESGLAAAAQRQP